MLRTRETPSLTAVARMLAANVVHDEAAVARLFDAMFPPPRDPADIVTALGVMTELASQLLRDLARAKGQDPADYARALVRSVQAKESRAS